MTHILSHRNSPTIMRSGSQWSRLKSPPEWELYDLQTDPAEFQNRAAEASLADVRSRLERALREWQQRTKDPFRDAQFRQSVEKKYTRKP